MANDEHLAILKQGVEDWNRWREENPDIEVDLHLANLHGASLAGVRFSGTNLDGADLSGAFLVQADLFGAHLSGANLSKADLSSANVSGAYLFRANLLEAHGFWTDLSGANLSEANLHRVSIFGGNLSGANLRGADLSRAVFRRTDLSGADLSCANLSEVCLSGADLSGANLLGANLSGTDVSGLKYDRKAMRGHYFAIRGLESCYGNPIFKRDAQDQEYIDALKVRYDAGWRKLLFRLWAWTDFGRSMPRVAGFALFLVLIFGTVYKCFPNLIDYGRHSVTPFTPYYFSFVTYTTLGFGDVTAGCLIGEILVTIEVVLGYLTLGLLLAILANTVARRS